MFPTQPEPSQIDISRTSFVSNVALLNTSVLANLIKAQISVDTDMSS